jgi:peptidylprolyl isomerase
VKSRLLIAIPMLAAALAVAGCGGDDETETSTTPSAAQTDGAGAGGANTEASAPKGGKPEVEVPSGPPPKKLVIEDLRKGDGPEAKGGDQVLVHYVGVDYETGKQFDASWDSGQPFPFQLGAGAVIPGWDRGVEGMRVGGRRELIIPPNLAYGAAGFPPAIAPNATLVFVIDLLAVQ